MTPERWPQVEKIFHAAMEQAPEKRRDFLNESCSGDEALRRDVEALLEHSGDGEEDFARITSALAADFISDYDAANQPLIGQTMGHYKILGSLGTGGMGEIYLAHDATLDRKVALKLLPRRFTQDPDRLRRFEQESRAASALNHPNIITIYEIGEAEGVRFIATEYIEGKTLREALEEKGGRSLTEVLETGMQCASALAAAHQAGIVHRDIKPANIMVRSDGYVKLLDFGLAKLTTSQSQPDVTEAGRVIGTINYMSPEQAMGQPLDHRTDIFSLGVVLYEIATGHRLFEKQSEGATYDAILHEEPPPLPGATSLTPVAFEQVLRRALAKNREQRYQSAAALRADLKLLAQGTGQTEAARLAAIAHGAEPRSRVKRMAATGLAVAAAVTIFLGYWFYKGDRQEPISPAIPRKSVAVLPFASASRDDEGALFADGIQDQVTLDLGKIADLKVVSRASVTSYRTGAARNLRQVGQQLGVAYLVEGTVERMADKIRVTAQLMEAENSIRVWVQTYDSELSQALQIQSEIAKTVANQLRANLSRAEQVEIDRPPTTDFTAFHLYTRAKKLMDAAASNDNTEQNLRDAVELLKQAVERDPRFLIAYCELSRAHHGFYLSGFDNTPQRLALGKAAVEAARKLSPASSDTHLAAAMHHYARLEYDQVREELSAARAVSPNDPRISELNGYVNRRQGRWAESTRDLERVIQFDPLNVNVLQELVSNHEALRAYQAARDTADRVLALRPDRFGARFARANQDLFERGDIREWRKLLNGRLEVDPESAQTLAEYRVTIAFYERDLVGVANALAALGSGRFGTDGARFSRAFGEGLLARISGDTAAARAAFSADRVAQEQVVQAQPDYGPAVSMMGLIEAGLGHKEAALRAGRRAVELLPVSKDSIKGPTMTAHLAIIAAWTGETDLAIGQLREAAKTIAVPHYGILKLDPMWDPLRQDRRFEKLLTSLAPK